MGNAQQGDALPGTVGIFQPIAGLGAEKPGFRIPAPAAVGGMENPVVRNEVGQPPLAEHRKVEAVAPWQIRRGIFRCKGNAPLGEHPGDFLVAAGGGAAAAPGSARHQGVLADQFLLAALAPAPPENATPCPPLPTVLQHGAFSKPLALQVPYPILMGTPAAAGVPTFQFMGVHLHHLTAVALTVPKGARPRLGPVPQRAHHQLPKPLPGEVLPPHAATADGAPLAQVARRDLALRPIVALTLPDCTSIGPPRLRQRQDGQAAKSLAGKVIRTRVGRQPQLWVIPRRRLVPRVVIPPLHWQVQRYQASRPVTPAGAGTCSTTVSRPKVFPTMGTLALVTLSPPLFYGQAPVPVKQTQGPAYATKNPGISWDTRDSRIFNMVTRRGFEPRTHCLKGSCSAD